VYHRAGNRIDREWDPVLPLRTAAILARDTQWNWGMVGGFIEKENVTLDSEEERSKMLHFEISNSISQDLI